MTEWNCLDEDKLISTRSEVAKVLGHASNVVSKKMSKNADQIQSMKGKSGRSFGEVKDAQSI